jgi:hypothetical protein
MELETERSGQPLPEYEVLEMVIAVGFATAAEEVWETGVAATSAGRMKAAKERILAVEKNM